MVIGLNIVTWTATDLSARTADCTQLVTVVCPPSYSVLNNNELSGTMDMSRHFQSDGVIESSQSLEANSTGPVNVIYDSGTGIDLESGFEVRQGVLFEAYIDGCGGG